MRAFTQHIITNNNIVIVGSIRMDAKQIVELSAFPLMQSQRRCFSLMNAQKANNSKEKEKETEKMTLNND